MCGPNRGRIHTLSNISLAVSHNRFITVVNRSNSNGSAFVGVLNLLSIPADNRCGLSKRGASGLSSSRVDRVQGGRVNFVFRNFGLVSDLATRRGIRLPLTCHNVPGTRHRILSRSTLGHIKLRGQVGRLPGRVSNNRRREITVTHTMTTGPPVVLTSRPANGLSDRSKTRIVQVLRRLRHRNEAIVLVARSGRVTTGTRQMVHVRSNRIVRSCVGTSGWARGAQCYGPHHGTFFTGATFCNYFWTWYVMFLLTLICGGFSCRKEQRGYLVQAGPFDFRWGADIGEEYIEQYSLSAVLSEGGTVAQWIE